MSNALAAQVEAWNKANARANELAVTLAGAFRPLIGKKIICEGGRLMEKYKHLCPPRHNAITASSVDCYQACRTCSLNWTVRACEIYNASAGHGGAVYAEAYVIVGEIKDGVLTAVSKAYTNRRTDYTVEEVLRLRAELERAEEAYRHAEGALCPFNRYDQ